MNKAKLLVVDDDSLIVQAVRIAARSHWHVTGVQQTSEIPHFPDFHAAFVDLHLCPAGNDYGGLLVIEQLRRQNPDLEIVAMSGDRDREGMEAALRAGAMRFLAKPLSADELHATLEKIVALRKLQAAEGVQWVGKSQAALSLQRQIANLKGEGGPILIEGESGTGKEVVAQMINAQEETNKFVAFNVAGVSETLFESELFGHVRGAFTGAEQNKKGLLESADNGDLFLDEIEALSSVQQVKLLRFLETQEIRRVGSNEQIQITARIIAATNKNLEKMVADGHFREDLLWRLNGKKILLPPLRERLDDIVPLAEYFLRQDHRNCKELASDAADALISYSWPGNVRELKRVVEQLQLIAPLPIIRAEDVLKVIQPRVESAPAPSLKLHHGLSELIGRFEAHVIRQATEQYRDIDEAAKVLKISRSNLYKKLKDHNIHWKSQV